MLGNHLEELKNMGKEGYYYVCSEFVEDDSSAWYLAFTVEEVVTRREIGMLHVTIQSFFPELLGKEWTETYIDEIDGQVDFNFVSGEDVDKLTELALMGEIIKQNAKKLSERCEFQRIMWNKKHYNLSIERMGELIRNKIPSYKKHFAPTLDE